MEVFLPGWGGLGVGQAATGQSWQVEEDLKRPILLTQKLEQLIDASDL